MSGSGDSLGASVPSTFLTSSQPGLASSLATTSAALVRTADAVGGVGWDHGRTRLALVAGLETADMTANGAWISATADVTVGDGTAMTVALRQESRNAAVQTPVFSLGLRMVHWPVMFTHGTKPIVASGARQHEAIVLQPVRVDVADNVVYVHVLLPTAHQVVLAGDLTDWRPVVMMDEQGGGGGYRSPAPTGSLGSISGATGAIGCQSRGCRRHPMSMGAQSVSSSCRQQFPFLSQLSHLC